MLRKPFISTRQPSANRFVPRRLAFAYPHVHLQSRIETGHPCRWTPVRSRAATGRVRSGWLMIGTRDAITSCRNILSRSRHALSNAHETCSTAFLTTYRQSRHKHYGNTPKTVLEGVFEHHTSSLSENRRERHSRPPLEHHRPKRPQPYCQKGWKPKLLRLGLNQ